MSECLRRDELERYHAQELSEEHAARVRTHLETCPDCAKRDTVHLEAEQRLLDDLRNLGPTGVAELDAAPSAAKSGTAPQALLGLAIEGYIIVEELHRGGQGIVYRAIQEHAKREVAIKVLLEGPYASPAAKRRFEREIELAAQLKHPNIVTVFHSGLTPDGRQYCVMDFVHGLRLNQYVRDQALSLEDTLAVFVTVCDAVMYAHQRGIIHRDLKPSNIIVDTIGEPKVLDFGLAKQMFGTADTFTSLSGQVFGTLPYMSPEQTSGRPEEIDTRSDIYALGVILYQLLTGHFPYTVEDRLPDVIRHITDTPPIPPSRAWTSQTGVARRAAQPVTSKKCPIDDEVQTIVLKTLAKEPERRYQSALELANDVRHYLAGEPIAAKRTSHWYVLQKTVRRYRLRFAVAAAMVLLAVGSSVALSIMYGRQTVLLTKVELERNRAFAAEGRAERRFGQIRELARTFIFDFHDQIQHLKGSTTARVLLVKTALEYLDGLAGEAGDDASLQRELALAYQKVADVQGAPGAPNLGDSAGAVASYEKAARIFAELAAADSPNVSAMRDLADCHYKLGNLRSNMHETAETAADYEKAFGIYEKLARLHPEDLDIQRGLARGYLMLGDVRLVTGRTAEARASYERSLHIRENVAAEKPENMTVLRELSIAYGRLGDAQEAMGDREAALSSRRTSLAISEARATAEPDNALAQRDLSEDLRQVGDVLRSLGQFEDALALYQRSLGIKEDLAHSDPDNTEAQRDLALGYNRVGGVQRLLGDLPAALASYQNGLEIVQAWTTANPGDVRPQNSLRVFHTTIGYCQGAMEQWPAALASYQQALAIAETLAAADPENAKAQRDLSVGHYRIGGAYESMGRSADALVSYTKCREIREHLAEADPANIMFQRNLAEVHFELGTVHATLGAGETLTPAERLNNWHQARSWFQLAYDTHIAMHAAGTLLSYDVEMPEEGAKRIAECDAAIARLQQMDLTPGMLDTGSGAASEPE